MLNYLMRMYEGSNFTRVRLSVCMCVFLNAASLSLCLSLYFSRCLYISNSTLEGNISVKRGHSLQCFYWSKIFFFVGPLIPLFWTSGYICPGFQSQAGSCLHAFLPALLLRFTSGATPADLLMASRQPVVFPTCISRGRMPRFDQSKDALPSRPPRRAWSKNF